MNFDTELNRMARLIHFDDYHNAKILLENLYIRGKNDIIREAIARLEKEQTEESHEL